MQSLNAKKVQSVNSVKQIFLYINWITTDYGRERVKIMSVKKKQEKKHKQYISQMK